MSKGNICYSPTLVGKLIIVYYLLDIGPFRKVIFLKSIDHIANSIWDLSSEIDTCVNEGASNTDLDIVLGTSKPEYTSPQYPDP